VLSCALLTDKPLVTNIDATTIPTVTNPRELRASEASKSGGTAHPR
jgi:hypothetical protein